MQDKNFKQPKRRTMSKENETFIKQISIVTTKSKVVQNKHLNITSYMYTHIHK